MTDSIDLSIARAEAYRDALHDLPDDELTPDQEREIEARATALREAALGLWRDQDGVVKDWLEDEASGHFMGRGSYMHLIVGAAVTLMGDGASGDRFALTLDLFHTIDNAREAFVEYWINEEQG